MSRPNFSVGFGVGILVGILGTIALMGGQDVPRARAQDQATTPGLQQRYQLSSWAHAGASNGSGAMHGAFILDTQTGKVWQIRAGGPEPVGQVK